MEKATIVKLNKSFEESAYEQEGLEYWLARELQELLGYMDWRNFSNTIEKAKESCKTTGEAVSDHFVDVNKTIPMPKGASKEVADIMLTRYACYLIAQNGDSKKEQIATEITNFNVTQNNLKGEASITNEHVKNNEDIRDLLGKSGIKPENLPPDEDIKKLERRVNSNDKKLLSQIKKKK